MEVYEILKSRMSLTLGPDGIIMEMLSALDNLRIDKIIEIIYKKYDTGDILEDLNRSIFIKLPNKFGANECKFHQTIKLMSHISKIIIHVLMKRAYN